MSPPVIIDDVQEFKERESIRSCGSPIIMGPNVHGSIKLSWGQIFLGPNFHGVVPQFYGVLL